MSLKDLCEEFIAAGNGELHLGAPGNGCKMPYVVGPDGKRDWQQLMFWGGHGPSNQRFIVNPPYVIDGVQLDAHLLAGRVVVRTPLIPPMGDLNEGARAAARAVLDALTRDPRDFPVMDRG